MVDVALGQDEGEGDAEAEEESGSGKANQSTSVHSLFTLLGACYEKFMVTDTGQ
jgi:hypothetical protein